MNDLIGSKLCRSGKWNLILIPGGLHHTFCIIFQVSGCSFHHISHTVNETNFHGNAVCNLDFHSIFWHKFGFRCHNGFACCRLRQFIRCPVPFMRIFHMRQHQHIHKTLDKRGFSGSDGTDHPYVDFAARPLFDIPV